MVAQAVAVADRLSQRSTAKLAQDSTGRAVAPTFARPRTTAIVGK
jgi:hypothetical protein